MRRLPIATPLALVLAIAIAGCNTDRTLWQLGLGSFATDLVVEYAAPRGPYLDVTLSNHGLSMRTFTPNSEVCQRVFQRGEPVSYVERGVGGRFDRDDDECMAVGIGDPLIAGGRRPRAGELRQTPIPRATARFEIIYTDEDVVLLRGRFPLAGTVGWARGDDTVAVIANIPACARPMQGGIASMEFRGSGRYTLTLVSPDGRCRIDGLALPEEAFPRDPDSEA